MKKWILIAGLAVSAVLLLAVVTRTPIASPEPAAEAAEGPAVEILAEAGGTEGFTYAVDADDERAVFGRGRELVVVDASNPAAPVETRAVALAGDVRGVVLAGDLAYVAADTAGLQIVDLKTGSVSGSLRFEDRAHGVAADGGHLYVAARSQGLRIVDAADAADPQEIGHLITADEAVGVVVRGEYAYVAAWYESVRTVDVSDPAAPVEVSFAPYDSYDHGAVWAVAVDDDLAVAAVPEIGVRIIDVSDLRDIKLHTRYRDLHAPAGVALRGKTAFVADQGRGLRVLDLSDPSKPVEIGSLALPGRAMAVRVVCDIAYVAAREGGLRLVDVSMPNDPREIGFVASGDAIVDVASTGGVTLAAGARDGVYRFDASGSLVRESDEPARRIAMDGSYVVAAGPDGVRIFEEGRLIAGVPREANGVALRGEVMVTAEPGGIRIFEMAMGGTPREASFFQAARPDPETAFQRAPPVAWDVLLDEVRAYAAFDDGVYLIDLSVRQAPKLLGRLETPERVYRLLLADEKLYAACDDGLRVIDISDPAKPVESAYLKTHSFATALLLDGERLYVGDLSGRITAVRPADARSIGTWRVADRVYALAAAAEGIAVATGAGGLRVVALGGELAAGE